MDGHSRGEIFAVGLSDVLADFDGKTDWKERQSKSSWCNIAVHRTTVMQSLFVHAFTFGK